MSKIFLRFEWTKNHVILGKFRKARSYQHDSVMEAVMLSVENLRDGLKERYKQLAIFLDDVGIPTKVRL